MPIDFPNDFFDPPTERPANWPDDPDLRRAVGWLKSIMTETEWKQRRDAAANRLYDAALQRLDDPSGKGRFFAESDTFGWYLFLGDAFLDHIGNYEPMFGSRVVPILQAIGRNLPLLQGVRGRATWLKRAERSVFCDAHFTVEVADVPSDYLTGKVKQWLASSWPSLLWNDEIGYGAVGDLDLEPLRSILATDCVLAAGTRMHELLTGQYIRFANYIQVMRVRPAKNPRYVDDCDLAILLRRECLASAAIESKARDVFSKIVEANDQLPEGTPGIVHVGFEAVDGDAVEQARYEKILASARRFKPGTKQLEYIYCHYFVPESPPDQAFAFDETTQWCSIHPTSPRPLKDVLLLAPEATIVLPGPHWQS